MNCYYCGRRMYGSKGAGPARQTTDHMIPRRRGGAKVPYNTVKCCDGCNIDKGCLTLEEFRVVIAYRQGVIAPDAAVSQRFWGELNNIQPMGHRRKEEVKENHENQTECSHSAG